MEHFFIGEIKMIRFGYYTDSHLMGINPEKRTDDFPQTLLNKIDEVYETSKNKKVDFMLFGGDLFNSHRIYSYEVINGFLEILEKYQLKTYFIIGQHDLYGYNKESYDKSALKFAEQRSGGLFIPVWDNVELENCIIHSCHVFDDVHERLQEVDKNDKFQVMLVHELLHDKPEIFEVINTGDLPSNELDLVLSGDLHCGYDYHEVNGTAYYNPGSLARIKNNKSNRERIIKFGLFEVNSLLGEYNISIDEHILKNAKPSEEVFDQNASIDVEVSVKGVSVDSFIENFQELEQESIHVFHLVEMIGKQADVRKDLIEYIMKFKGNENA